eukprot:4840100-Amphidinium_carterae.1
MADHGACMVQFLASRMKAVVKAQTQSGPWVHVSDCYVFIVRGGAFPRSNTVRHVRRPSGRKTVYAGPHK